MKIQNINDLDRAIVMSVLPESVIIDVLGRILGYILSGGNVEDSYIKQQFKYVEKVIREIKKKQFTQRTLNILLDEIMDEYFSDETIEHGLGMWEVIDYVKRKYGDEIATLPK